MQIKIGPVPHKIGLYTSMAVYDPCLLRTHDLP